MSELQLLSELSPLQVSKTLELFEFLVHIDIGVKVSERMSLTQDDPFLAAQLVPHDRILQNMAAGFEITATLNASDDEDVSKTSLVNQVPDRLRRSSEQGGDWRLIFYQLQRCLTNSIEVYFSLFHYWKKRLMAESGKRRRSARISALEDTLKAQQATCEEYDAFFENDEIVEQVVRPLPEHGPEPGSRKRGRKKRMRSVDEVLDDNSIKSMEVLVKEVEADQRHQNQEHENYQSNNGQPLAESSSVSQMPEKRFLNLVIDILQKRDSRNIFAVPVDPTEVKGYYDIVKEPMDLFTLKEKLEQGTYKSLEKFEHDVFLIFNNAMHFNGAATIFHKQARAMHGLATKVFHTLRTDPENLESEYSLARRRPGRKPKCEARTSNSTALHASNGTREVRRSNTSGAGARCTYRPRESFQKENESLISEISNCSKPLVPGNLRSGQYRESLMRFAEGLGPTAQMVANRKLQQYQVSRPSQIPASSELGWLTPPDSVRVVPTSQISLASSSIVTNFGEGSDVHGALGGKISNPSESIKSPICGIRDLNLPVDDGPREGDSYLSMMVDACKADAKVSPDALAQAKLVDFNVASSSTNNNYGSFSLPFQAMRASSSRQVPSFSIAGLESQSQGMVARAPNYGAPIAQQTSSPVQELSLPRARLAQSLHGENRVSSPTYASNITPQAGLVAEGRRQKSLVYPTTGVHQTRTQSDPSYRLSSSQTVPFLERNQPSSLVRPQHSSVGLGRGLFGLSRLSNGADSFSQSKMSSDHLSGRNQTMAKPSQNQGLGSGQTNADTDLNTAHLIPSWSQPGMQKVNPSLLYGDMRKSMNAPMLSPTQSYGITNSSQPKSPLDWNQRKLWGAQFGDARQGMNPLAQPAMPSYGISNTPQPNSSLAWNQHQLWGAQSSNNNSFYLQPHASAMVNSWNQNGFVQSQLMRMGSAGSDATPLPPFGRNSVQNKQSQPNPNPASVDNQQPDVSLQL